MKACGIVAEYNPFHKGHAYQIEQIKANKDVDLIIAVMSGNFLQRGEPAVLDKWTRTKMALAGGIDLVIELPVVWSTQPADYFAKGALQILSTLNIHYLSFGVENGNREDFLEAASYLVAEEEEISRKIQENQEMNVPYAKQMENIVLKMNPNFPLDFRSPNIQLGLSYQKEIINSGFENKIDILPIQRKGAGYAEESIKSQSEFASATAIRKAMFRKELVQSYLPSSSADYLYKKIEEKVSWENYFQLLKYQLTVQSESELREIYQMTEGLENRLKKYIQEAHSFEEFIDKVKTKRYTRTRLQRLLTYVLLQMKAVDIYHELENDPTIRVLGFNQTGQAYLSQQKHQLTRPILSNVNQKTKKELKYDIVAGNIYQLGNHLIEKQDFTTKPIKFN